MEGKLKYGLTQDNPGIQLQLVFHPTARARAATREHPEELKAPRAAQLSCGLCSARGKRSRGMNFMEANHQHPAVPKKA